jgi:PAS domain S-box-containing protein
MNQAPKLLLIAVQAPLAAPVEAALRHAGFALRHAERIGPHEALSPPASYGAIVQLANGQAPAQAIDDTRARLGELPLTLLLEQDEALATQAVLSALEAGADECLAGQAALDPHALVQAVHRAAARWRAGRFLRERAERFGSLLEFSGDWYWEQDAQLRFTLRGGSGPGFSHDARYLGRMRWELPHLGMSEADWAQHRAQLEAHLPFRDLQLVRPNERGDPRHLCVSGFPMFDRGGRFLGYRGLTRDVTESQRAQAALVALEARNRQLVDLSPDSIHIDQDERIVFANGACARLLRAGSPQDVIGRSIYDMVEPAQREQARAHLRATERGVPPHIELQVQAMDGSLLTVEVAAAPIAYNGRPAAQVVMRDATERRKGQEALRESQHFLQQAMEVGRIGSWIYWTDERQPLVWSRHTCHILGVDPERFDGKVASYLERVHPDDRAMVSAAVARAIASRSVYETEHRIVRPDGELRWVHERAAVQCDSLGTPARLLGVVQDITEQKQAAVERHQANQRLRILSERLMRAQENERARIARELHDEIGQALTSLKIYMRGLQRLAQQQSDTPQIEECVSILDQLLTQVRAMSLDLRPPQLDDFGLSAALRWHIARLSRTTGMPVEFSASPHDIRLDVDLEMACFRVAQEALTNVLRHAAATEAWVTLRQSGVALSLSVRDNGQGFDLAAVQALALHGHSVGLLGMEERVVLAGGELRIVSQPGRGTDVSATFPVLARARAA